MNNISVYQGRQMGGGVPSRKKLALRPYLVVYAPHTGVSNVCEVKNVPLLFQNKECVWKMCSFDRGHCLHDVIHVIKWTSLLPLFLHTASNGWWEGLGK